MAFIQKCTYVDIKEPIRIFALKMKTALAAPDDFPLPVEWVLEICPKVLM
jgi:hypothetical protein